jgi:hypothetical protein
VIEMPGMRCVVSAALRSGKAPIWSAEAMLVMFGAVRCWFSARAFASVMRSPCTLTVSS